MGWNDTSIKNDISFGLGTRSKNLALWAGIVAAIIASGEKPELIEATWSQKSGVLNKVFHLEKYANWTEEIFKKVDRLLNVWTSTVKYLNDHLTKKTGMGKFCKNWKG